MTEALHDVLRFGPAVVLASTVVWLAVATRVASVRLGRPAYGFDASRRQRTAQLMFRVSVVLGLAAVLSDASGVEWGPFAVLVGHTASLKAVGLLGAICGQILVVAAQATMGGNWRVGVSDRRPDALVTTGLFAVSRNPVFLGMLAMAVGIAVAVPSPAAFVAAAAFFAACEVQVRDEERALAAAFGNDYAVYRNSVRRWI